MRSKQKQAITTEKPNNGKVQFVIAISLTILLIVLCAFMGMSYLFKTSNHLYPKAPDILEQRNNQTSSYYLTDPRNALVISSKTQGFNIEFPNFVEGTSKNLWDYSETELLKYKLIYIIEPMIDTQSQKDKFEAMITTLIINGVVVMIEPLSSKIFNIFDLHADDEMINSTPTFINTVDNPYNMNDAEIVKNSHLGMIRALYGLDKVYANFTLENGSINCAVLGSKKVGNGEVIFVGTHLSQYLEPVYISNNGSSSIDDIVSKNSEAIKAVYSALFSYYGISQEYLPSTFDTVTEQHWDYRDGTFTYSSKETKDITVAVTYSPKWKVTLDGNPIHIGEREHLIRITLPAGIHTVKLRYVITRFESVWYMVALVGLLIFLQGILMWNWNKRLLQRIRKSLLIYLQINEGFSKPLRNANIITSEPLGEIAVAITELLEPIEVETQENDDNGQPTIYHQTSKNVNGIMLDIIELIEEHVQENTEEDILFNDKTEVFDEHYGDIPNEISAIEDAIENIRKADNEMDSSMNQESTEDISELVDDTSFDEYDEILRNARMNYEIQKKIEKDTMKIEKATKRIEKGTKNIEKDTKKIQRRYKEDTKKIQRRYKEDTKKIQIR